MDLAALAKILAENGPLATFALVLLAMLFFLIRRVLANEIRAWSALEANTKSQTELTVIIRERLPK